MRLRGVEQRASSAYEHKAAYMCRESPVHKTNSPCLHEQLVRFDKLRLGSVQPLPAGIACSDGFSHANLELAVCQ